MEERAEVEVEEKAEGRAKREVEKEVEEVSKPPPLGLNLKANDLPCQQKIGWYRRPTKKKQQVS